MAFRKLETAHECCMVCSSETVAEADPTYAPPRRWEAVGGKQKKARFPGTNLNAASFPLEMFQGDGERWRQLGGKNLSILFMFYQSWGSGWRRSWRACVRRLL